jgi:hypothetical protein
MDGHLLMARLSPRLVGLETIGSGRCEVSPKEACDALGMIADTFSRELFCYVWWPDGTKNSSREIELMVLHRVMEECKRRAMTAVDARLAYTIAELELTANRAISRAVGGTLAHYHELMELAEQRKWPTPRPAYRSLVHGALVELKAPKVCSRCHGTGHSLHHGVHIACSACHETGALMQSDLARARTLGMTWHAYRKAWKAPYEWTVDTCSAATKAAERAFWRHFGCT